MAVFPAEDLFPGELLFPDLVRPSGLRVTVSAAAVSLTPASVGFAGRRVVIRNMNTSAADTLSLGGSSAVTAASGFLLDGGAQIVLPLSPGDEVWAIRGTSADVAVHILRFGPQ